VKGGLGFRVDFDMVVIFPFLNETTYMTGAIYIVNFILSFLIFHFETNSPSDKTGFISFVFFLILMTVNFVCGILSYFDKRSYYKHFYYSIALLFVMAIVTFN